jgi:LemA protein
MTMFILVVVGFLVWLITSYNGLVKAKNKVNEAVGGIDVQLKKRHDLIPKLISVVKKHQSFEEKILTNLTQLRTKATNTHSFEEKVSVEKDLDHALKQFLVSVENYPDLKSNSNYLHLQRSVNEVEEQLSAVRRYYNSEVTELNNKVLTFPSRILASFFHFKTESYFETRERERQDVDIDAEFEK